MEMDGLKVKRLNEGKTKVIYELEEDPNLVLIHSKDRITAGDGARSNELEGKAVISTSTNVAVYELLNRAGIKTHFVRSQTDRSFVARKCEMIPIEFVIRRVATGSFLKRNPGVPEGFKFYPVKLEYFFKDDAKHDPQWSYEQIITSNLTFSGVQITLTQLEIINKTAQCVFEILEKSWNELNCSLIDMKIEFGVDCEKKTILLADIIDSDSWRLWPSGDKRLMKDKQVYRDLKEVTTESLQVIKDNFKWVADQVQSMLAWKPRGKVAVLMGSSADLNLGEEIKKLIGSYGVECVLRVTSAHKGPDMTLKIVSEYEGQNIPCVLIAIAGRSNGLGPTVSANTSLPVINCPPISSEWGPYDIWSSLRLPSGLSCTTVLAPETAALNALRILALSDVTVWNKVKVDQLNNWVKLLVADEAVNK
ncbi:hypothetical protein HELRODRAFT_186294 [Helobdella robusta]|uniref:PurE domain-containing protein n=1 Tax=Helobdella robusta TaxID=6412 RepID=T1FNX9_HELRO|nr:hypothetical protein HELRODRAFT_186294 [Helobdella robusta]ESO09736.1 hypothetical protein HELRODRAFT_186294 [Helobdella robusta]